jgi:hypothetical protein
MFNFGTVRPGIPLEDTTRIDFEFYCSCKVFWADGKVYHPQYCLEHQQKGIGPNGGPITFNQNGDMVELLEDETNPEYGMILRRNDNAIHEACDEFWHKVWYGRHRFLSHPDGSRCTDSSQPGCDPARALEDKYGADNLRWTDYEWGELSGKLSALSWVLGSEWDESLDT